MTRLFQGGTIANTLNAVPNAIDKMLKDNYKKVAELSYEFYVRNNEVKQQTYELPIEFIPTRYIIDFFVHTQPRGFVIDTKYLKRFEVQSVGIFEVLNTDNKSITLQIKNLNFTIDYFTIKIIAIE